MEIMDSMWGEKNATSQSKRQEYGARFRLSILTGSGMERVSAEAGGEAKGGQAESAGKRLREHESP